LPFNSNATQHHPENSPPSDAGPHFLLFVHPKQHASSSLLARGQHDGSATAAQRSRDRYRASRGIALLAARCRA
jgi:hypothetical protein